MTTLNSAYSNIPDFINGLFASGARNYHAVNAAIADGDIHQSLADDASRGRVLNAWLAAWMDSQGDTPDPTYNFAPEVDRQLIGFIANLIKAYTVSMSKPDLDYQGVVSHTTKAVYKNSGYDNKPFLDANDDWYYGGFDSDGHIRTDGYAHRTVARFLQLLYYGAHFVWVQSPDDGSTLGNFYDDFVDAFGTEPLGNDKANSHYSTSATVNTSGWYWLDITSDAEPTDTTPLIAAFLAGKTSDTSSTNTFFQLEGWQAHFPYAFTWHSDDYDAHKDTIWNFSTFGASANSEKRCTPIFLTDGSFDLTLDSNTKMPLYAGAGSVRGWMELDLIET